MRFIESFDAFARPLLEGGKALDSVRRILKEEVKPTFDDLQEKFLTPLKLKLGKSAIQTGSAGQKPESGDLDLGVEKSLEEVDAFIKQNFPEAEVNWMKGLEVLSMSWPIEGDPKNGFVQVDMIPIKNEKWFRFVYEFPFKDSKYKSAHRNWLLAAVVSTMIDKKEKDDQGNVVSEEGYMFKLNDGFFSVKKSFQGKTKLLKHSKKESEHLITQDPDIFVKMAFGPAVKPKELGTFESIYRIINKKDFKFFDRLDLIKKNYTDFLKRVGLPIPNELT